MGTKKVLAVSNFDFDNTTDLFKLLKKIKNDFKTLPSYIDYVTYKGTDFLTFITTKYNQGYHIIIGNFYSSQCLSVFDFLNNHNDLLLISSASTAMFPKQMPNNLIRLPSNDENAFSLFKNKVLDSMNQVLLMVDPTLSNFPRQQKLINLNEKTFVKTVNVIYTDENIYNLSYVRMIKRSITGNEPYKFKFFKIDSATIKQNKLTPGVSTILKTNDASNVFMILTISYAQQFLNILSSNFEYVIQMIFFSDSFTSYNFTVKTQLPYGYTLINEIETTNIDYYQRALFNNNSGYINYYTVSILQFLKTRTELINNVVINGLSITNMIDVLSKSNEFINGQPINDKRSMIKINYLLKASNNNKSNKPKKPKRKVLGGNISRILTQWGSAAAAAEASSTRAIIQQTTSTISGSQTNSGVTSLNTFLPAKLEEFKSYIPGLQYIRDNTPSIFSYVSPPNNISDLLNFRGTDDIDTFCNNTYTYNELSTYFKIFIDQLNKYDKATTTSNDKDIVTTTPPMKKSTFFKKFKMFILVIRGPIDILDDSGL